MRISLQEASFSPSFLARKSRRARRISVEEASFWQVFLPQKSRREIGGADQRVPTIRIVFRMQVRMHQKASAARVRKVVEYFKITNAGGDIFGKPARDTDAFRNILSNCARL